MTAAGSQQPSIARIAKSQNEQRNRTRVLAWRRFYADAKAVHFGAITVSLLLALAGPFVLWLSAESGAWLGATAGGWVFVSRVFLVPFRNRREVQGALVQEAFDVDIFELDWNPSIPLPVAPEEVSRAAKRAAKKTAKKRNPWTDRDWYATKKEAPWPYSVFISQRSSVVWARRQHQWFGHVLKGTVFALVGIGILIAIVVFHATLAQYLTTILLPSLPAILDGLEEAHSHLEAAEARHRLELATNEEIGSTTPNESRLRAFQDQLFSLRRKAPLVPEWFYKLRRQKLEEDMQQAQKELADRLEGTSAP